MRRLKYFLTPLVVSLVVLSPQKVEAKDKEVKYVNVNSRLNVRSDTNAECAILGKLYNGDEVVVLEDLGDWLRIEYEERQAYVCSTYITDEKPETSEGVYELQGGRSLGVFTLSHYCACATCCGVSTGITASGAVATANRTIAVDTGVIPFGTKVSINGQIYVAEDTGGGVNGNWIDIFCSSHQEALNRGLQQAEVFIVE